MGHLTNYGQNIESWTFRVSIVSVVHKYPKNKNKNKKDNY
jgi:hypothetical protein